MSKIEEAKLTLAVLHTKEAIAALQAKLATPNYKLPIPLPLPKPCKTP
jgi:hypothetical protein